MLMTAIPHSGDPSRFQDFLEPLGPYQFAIADLAREQIARDESPYFLRRHSEDVRDQRDADLFVPREVITEPFRVAQPGFASTSVRGGAPLYDAEIPDSAISGMSRFACEPGPLDGAPAYEEIVAVDIDRS